jgi:hypothetical protein
MLLGWAVVVFVSDLALLWLLETAGSAYFLSSKTHVYFSLVFCVEFYYIALVS